MVRFIVFLHDAFRTKVHEKNYILKFPVSIDCKIRTKQNSDRILTIYSLDGLIKRIDDGKQYSKVAVNDFENITYHYFNIYAGKKYFYVIYVGHKEDDNFFDRTLEVYNYEGNPIIKYTFDIIPFYFVVDEDNGYIYATNANYEDYLLRYKL